MEFLAIDPDLVVAAAVGVGGEGADRFAEERVRNWVARQQPECLEELVTALLCRGGGEAEALARRRYLADQPGAVPASGEKRRAVAELLALAEGVRKVRLERRLRSLMEPYGNRRALWQRLRDAGLA